MAGMQARRRWVRERALRMANSVAWPPLRVRADLMWRRQKKKPTSPTGCAGEPSTRDASPSFSRCMLDLDTSVYHRANKESYDRLRGLACGAPVCRHRHAEVMLDRMQCLMYRASCIHK